MAHPDQQFLHLGQILTADPWPVASSPSLVRFGLRPAVAHADPDTGDARGGWSEPSAQSIGHAPGLARGTPQRSAIPPRLLPRREVGHATSPLGY